MSETMPSEASASETQASFTLQDPEETMSELELEDEDDSQVKSENQDDASSPGSSSPPADGSSTPTTSAAASKRNTRKSTLTQQQKNQKRQRATQEQLNTLEIEFNKNPTPNASVRERIANEINMTERSVQIWFQNRRAKIKNMAKRSYAEGEDPDIPDSMRKYLAMQALESGGVMAAEFLGPGGLSYGPGMMLNQDASAKVMIAHIQCSSLIIGTWRRMGQTRLDLVVFYSPTKSMMTYYIQANDTGFRIEYPFSAIKNMTVEYVEKGSSAGGDALIAVELYRSPTFTMDQGANGWYSCDDFTEDHQASKEMRHELGGDSKLLQAQLAKLTSTDEYRNRHIESRDVKPGLGLSMPPHMSSMASMEQRPSSQPNHFAPPQRDMYMEQRFDVPQRMGPPSMEAPPYRGHKRQRSSSVPVAVNFGPRRQLGPPPMQNLHLHHHSHFYNPTPPHVNESSPFNGQHGMSGPPQMNGQGGHHTPNHIFAPTPQYAPNPTQFQQAAYGQMGPPLHIDIGSGFSSDLPLGPNFDFNTAPPLSATGTTPPSSEFEHILYPGASSTDLYSAPPTQTTFGNRFLSPVMDSPHIQEASVSPMSNLGAPTLQPSAKLSPPNTLFRSQSANPRVHFTNHTPAYQDDGWPPNDDSFFENGQFPSGFEDAKFSFLDCTTWGSGEQGTSHVGLADHTFQGGRSRGPSMTLAFRDSANAEKLQGPLPPATPPPQDEFDDLLCYDPQTPQRDQEPTTV